MPLKQKNQSADQSLRDLKKAAPGMFATGSIPPEETLSPMHFASMSSAGHVQRLLAEWRQHGHSTSQITAAVNAKATDGEYVGGYSPLHYACQCALPGAVTLLLDAGADPNQTKNNGATPLLCAIARAGCTPGKLRPYEQCMQLLFEHPRFDPDSNDQSGGARCSPAWVCVGQRYTAQDVLLPLLKLLLARGFDPNGIVREQSALHMAVRNCHFECALALVRAGAEVTATAPTGPDTEERWTVLEHCREAHGPAAASRLAEASAASFAVAGVGKRRQWLRQAAAAGQGAGKAARRALDAAAALTGTSQWLEASGAYEEALGYPEDALGPADRLMARVNLVACLAQCGRVGSAVDKGREFVKSTPAEPQLLLALGTALAHPKRGACLSEEDATEMISCVERAELALASGSTVDARTGASRAGMLERAAMLRSHAASGLASGASPACSAAGRAIDEFNQVDGCTIKAAAAVDEALALGHPNPMPIRALRGSIYYQWGKELLEGLRGEPKLEEATSKFAAALGEFEACAAAQIEGRPPSLFSWNAALALIAAGRVGEGCERALLSLAARLNETVIDPNLEETCTREVGPEQASSARGAADYLFHLEAAFACARLFAGQRAREQVAAAICTSFGRLQLSSSPSSPTSSTSQHDVVAVLERSIELELISVSEADKLTDQLAAGGTLSEEFTVAAAWTDAVRYAEEAAAAFAQCRRDAAVLVVRHVCRVREQIARIPSRVLSALLKEARLWDPSVAVPTELAKEKKRLASCDTCGAAQARMHCPCGIVSYCGRDCQAAAWKAHKRVCSARRSSKPTADTSNSA